MREEIQDLREHAQRCRRLARVAEDGEAQSKLKRMAREFDSTAEQLQAQLEANKPKSKDSPPGELP